MNDFQWNLPEFSEAFNRCLKILRFLHSTVDNLDMHNENLIEMKIGEYNEMHETDLLWQPSQSRSIETIALGAGSRDKLVQESNGLLTWIILILILHHTSLQGEQKSF